MGTTAPVVCQSCSAVNDVELKDVTVDPADDSISFSYRCVACGHQNKHARLSPDQASKLISPREEREQTAEWLGVSRETTASYVYPPDVMKQADLERRKIASTSVKETLKASRQPYPELREGRWWVVYKLEALSAEVHYDRDSKQYRIVDSRGAQQCDTVLALGEALRERLSGFA